MSPAASDGLRRALVFAAAFLAVMEPQHLPCSVQVGQQPICRGNSLRLPRSSGRKTVVGNSSP